MASRAVSVTEVLDSVPFTSYQVLVGILCFCCTLLDGFDLTVIGVAVPKIAEYLRVKPPALGVAMSAGQFGPLIGAALLGMLADRVGRKRMLVACAFGFGLFTLLCAFITSVGELALFRFIAGLGMGGAVPTAIAFGTEYAPTRPAQPSPPRCTRASRRGHGKRPFSRISPSPFRLAVPLRHGRRHTHRDRRSDGVPSSRVPDFPRQAGAKARQRFAGLSLISHRSSRRIRTSSFARPTRSGPACRSSTFFWKDDHHYRPVVDLFFSGLLSDLSHAFVGAHAAQEERRFD